MTQKRRTSALEKEQVRRELYVLLSEGLNKAGDDDSSLFGSEGLYYGEAVCERAGLYY